MITLFPTSHLMRYHMLDVKSVNGRISATISFSEMDPVTWRKIEKLLRAHAADKKTRKMLSAVKKDLEV